VREPDRELVVGNLNSLPFRVTAVAVNDGDGGAPVALAAEAPVLLAVGDRRLAEAALLERLTHPLARLRRAEPGVLARLDEDAVLVEGLGPALDRPEVPSSHRADDLLDGEAVGPGELEVAAVVRRHRHQRAGAVVAEHEVGDPDRHRVP